MFPVLLSLSTKTQSISPALYPNSEHPFSSSASYNSNPPESIPPHHPPIYFPLQIYAPNSPSHYYLPLADSAGQVA